MSFVADFVVGFGGIACLDEGARRMFALWRIELGEPRAKNSRLPVFATRGDLLLFHAIFNLPDFGAVVGRKAKNDELEERIVRTKIQFVMELSHERTELFEKSDANGFEVGRGFVGII